MVKKALGEIAIVLRTNAARSIKYHRKMFIGRFRNANTMPDIRFKNSHLFRKEACSLELSNRKLQLVDGEPIDVAALPVVAHYDRANVWFTSRGQMRSESLPHGKNFLCQDLKSR